MSAPLYHRPSDRITVGTWTIPTGTARTGYPLTNLDNSDPSDPFWANETTIRIVKDLLTALQVDHVYVFAHTFVNASTFKLQMHTADSWATPDVSITATIPTAYEDGYSYHLHFDVAAAYPSAANRTKRYLSLVNAVANSVTCAIGEVWIVGSARTLTRNVAFGFAQPRERLTSGNVSKRGVSTVYDYGSIERMIRGRIPAKLADYTDIRALEADAKGASLAFPFTISPSHTTARHAEPLLVRITKTMSDAPQGVASVFTDIELSELGRGELLGA